MLRWGMLNPPQFGGFQHPQREVTALAAMAQTGEPLRGRSRCSRVSGLIGQGRAAQWSAPSPAPDWRTHWLEGADHSFHVLKSSGRSDAEVMDEVARASADWLGGRVS